MRILVIGSGGREHALVWKLSRSSRVDRLYAAPGNPGIAGLAECVPLKASDTGGLLQFAIEHGVDLTVVGPEQPLADGLVDRFSSAGLRAFGPTCRAAELEWSKAYAKGFMQRHEVPTGSFQPFGPADKSAAREYLSRCVYPIVLKADGLAAGKGVVICHEKETALQTLADMMEKQIFGSAGATVVVEEFLAGEEASVLAVCDGRDYVVLASAQDHKRVFDHDQGKNTGGMGAYAPAPVVTPGVMKAVEESIIRPTLRGMEQEGRPFRGCLYCGLMITSDGPKVIENNARFGDPETQVVLPLYRGDFALLLDAAARGDLAALPPAPPPQGSAVCVVLASGGYPDPYTTGFAISGLDRVASLPDVVVFHAGTEIVSGTVCTSGGRVLGVTAMSEDPDLRSRIDRAYQAATLISFDHMHFRKDIGHRALDRRRF